jgi:hypothetical protein
MTIQLSLQKEVLLKYLYNPATDSFEALEPTLKDRFFKDGGRVDFKYGGTFEEYIKREDKYEDFTFEEWLREDKKDGGRVGFKTGPDIIINAYNSVKAALGFNPSIEQVRTNLKASGYSPALDYTKGILEGADLELDKPRGDFKKEVLQIYDDLKQENKKILTRDIANKVTTSKAKGNALKSSIAEILAQEKLPYEKSTLGQSKETRAKAAATLRAKEKPRLNKPRVTEAEKLAIQRYKVIEDSKRDPNKIKKLIRDNLKTLDKPIKKGDVHHPFPKKEGETLRMLMILDKDANRKGIVRSIEERRNTLIKEQNILRNRPKVNEKRLNQINFQMKNLRNQLKKTAYRGSLAFPITNKGGSVKYIGYNPALSLASLDPSKMADKPLQRTTKGQKNKLLQLFLKYARRGGGGGMSGAIATDTYAQSLPVKQIDPLRIGQLPTYRTRDYAFGGRVGFSDGSPNPEVMAQIKELLSGLNNTEVMDNALKNNAPSLEESMFGTKEESNLLQRLNQTLDPRAFPYYAAQLTKGLALAPEVAGRFTLAVPQFVGDVVQGKSFSKAGAETIAKLDPKFTQEKVIEGFGLQKILDDMDQDITGSQRSVGQILKMGGESLGPATGVGYFLSAGKAANQIRKELQKYTGTATAAKELEKSVEEKAASLQMTRREFNSLLAGGGIIGLVKALGLDTIFPAAKTVAQKAAPEIITKGGTPKYFFDFVNLIKTKGDDITETAATVERQKVYDYNGYTMYEDMTTGKISIRKDTEGGATYSIGDGEYETVDGIIRKEEINYEPSETILNEKGKPVKVPDQYDEATVRPDEDGGEGDFEVGLDSIDDILELLSKDGKTYSKEELLKMGIDADALGNYPTGAGSIPEGGAGDANPFKPKKAGGGIIKLAGDNSGPPPKSGPTPHGLPYIAKNVRPIKERK